MAFLISKGWETSNLQLVALTPVCQLAIYLLQSNYCSVCNKGFTYVTRTRLHQCTEQVFDPYNPK